MGATPSRRRSSDGRRDLPSFHYSEMLKLARCPHSLIGWFTLITRTAPCLRQLPSCVAVYPRDSRSRRVLCRSSHSLHSRAGGMASRLLREKEQKVSRVGEFSARLRNGATEFACGLKARPRAVALRYGNPLYLGCSRSARPLPSRLNRPCRSPQSLHSSMTTSAFATASA